MRIITNKILLSTLLATSLFLTGCSISGENTQEDEKPTNTATAETEKSSGFFSSFSSKDPDKAPKGEKTAETEGALGFLGSLFSDKDAEKDKQTNKDSEISIKHKEIVAKIKKEAEVERKKRIAAIKEGNISAKVRAKIAKDTRIEDIDVKLEEDLKSLKVQLNESEQQLAQTIESELSVKISSLDADTEIQVLSIKKIKDEESIAVISSVEEKISDTQSEVESKLWFESMAPELENIQRFKEDEKKFEKQYLDNLSATKFGLDKERVKRLTVMEQNIRAMRQSGQEMINMRMGELERERVAAALVIEKKVKAKNTAMIDKLIAKYKKEINAHSKSIKDELTAREKIELAKVNTRYTAGKSTRDDAEVTRKNNLQKDRLDKKKKVGEEMRNRLGAERDSQLATINDRLEKSVRKIYVDRKQALSTLKSENKRQLKKEKGELQAKHRKNKGQLKRTANQAKSKIRSKAIRNARTLNDQEERAIADINKDIDIQIKKGSDSALKAAN